MTVAGGWWHSLSPRALRSGHALRLVETLLVRNEVEAIADNLRLHAALGVDGFVVMDNGSTDGTREVLSELHSELDLHVLDRPDTDYRQSAWKTELAFQARCLHGADWTFNADADELWLPEGESLKDHLPMGGAILECPRTNYLHDRGLKAGTRRWCEAALAVRCPLVQGGVNVLEEQDLHLQLGTIKPKVLVNAHGLIRVKGGNHRAWHARAWRGARPCPGIHIAHFPLRSWKHFESHVRRRVQLLDAGVDRMGLHYKRWARMWRAGTLEEEFERLLIGPEEERVLTATGVLRRDGSTGNRIARLLNRPMVTEEPAQHPAAVPATGGASRERRHTVDA